MPNRLPEEAFFLGSYEPMLISMSRLHYLKMMYLESTCYHPPGARCAIDTVGIDHFLFGTDSPPLFVLKREGVDLINKLGLTAEEKNKVYYENAKKLFEAGRAARSVGWAKALYGRFDLGTALSAFAHRLAHRLDGLNGGQRRATTPLDRNAQSTPIARRRRA